MNNIVLINGSPKINYGASYNYLKFFNSEIINNIKYNEEDINKILNSDIIVFSFPLYIDSLPSNFIRFLNLLEDLKFTNKSIYAICNCGFYESIQCEIALNIIKNFCIKTQNKYMGGIAIGTGPIGFLNYPLINTNIKKKLKKFYQNVLNKSNFKNIYTKSKLPRFIYLKFANHSWKKQIKKNLIKK